MPRLIHLNGPPGIGKSTLAQRYVDDHPGVLNLDIDRLRCLVGGWQDRFNETGAIIRPVARRMAAAHLSGGRDVVMPQYLGRISEIERFETLAHDNAAAFCEIVLMDTKQQSLERFYRRGDHDDAAWHRQIKEIVEHSGGRRQLVAMYDQLSDVVNVRPVATVIPSAPDAIESTYQDVLSALTSTQ